MQVTAGPSPIQMKWLRYYISVLAQQCRKIGSKLRHDHGNHLLDVWHPPSEFDGVLITVYHDDHVRRFVQLIELRAT